MTTTSVESPLEPNVASAAGNVSAPNRKKPHLVIRARRGWVGIDMRELWRFRELLLSLTARDVKLRYKQTALGVIWVVFQPLVASAIFTYVFSKMANMPTPPTNTGKPVPYFLFAFAGMVAWIMFSTSVTKISTVLIQNSGLVSKVYFPRLLLPLSGATGTLVDLAVGAAMLLVLQMITGIGLTPQWLLAPVFLGLLMALALGIGTWAAALCVPYRDVGYMLPVFMQFLLFASPIPWMIDPNRSQLVYINPLAGLLDAWRWSVLATPFPPMWAFWYAAGTSLTLLFVGLMVFRRMERNFADVI
jgi:lipopolysaccharide transport system permease protein